MLDWKKVQANHERLTELYAAAEPDLEIVQGELDDMDSQTTAMHGADAVICCLGPAAGLGSAFKKQTSSTARFAYSTFARTAYADKLVSERTEVAKLLVTAATTTTWIHRTVVLT